MPVIALLLACTATSPRASATLPPTAGPQAEVAEDKTGSGAGGQGGGDASSGNTSPGSSSVPAGSASGSASGSGGSDSPAGGGDAAQTGQSVPITGQPSSDTLTTADLEDDNLLDIVTFGGSGNVDSSLTCNYIFASDAQAAANSSLKRVPSGTVLAYSDLDFPYSHISSDVLYSLPRICALEAGLLDAAVAVSPSGVGYAPFFSSLQIQSGTAHGATLPLEALRQPGVWTLQVVTGDGLYQLGVQIPVPAVPVYRRHERDVWVGGFGGGERVRGYGLTNGAWDIMEFQVDGQGYALFTTQTRYSALYLAGESGRTALPGQLQIQDAGRIVPADRDLLAEWLYLELWQGGAPPGMLPDPDFPEPLVLVSPPAVVLEPLLPLSICNNDLATRLSVGDKARLVLAGGYPFHIEPDQLADVAINVPQGTTLSIVDSPVCVDFVWWWKVEWNLKFSVAGGWLPETEGSQYVLEPLD